MLTALTVPVIYANAQIDFLKQPLFWTLLLLSLFVIFTHRSNIRKLLAGTENRFEKIRLIHRLLRRS